MLLKVSIVHFFILCKSIGVNEKKNHSKLEWEMDDCKLTSFKETEHSFNAFTKMANVNFEILDRSETFNKYPSQLSLS